tara:strand:- start:2115 stop:2504 length:390 start_codon:yes stop_codon:yes gene_type:complete
MKICEFIMEPLNDDNLLLVAMKWYDNPQGSTIEDFNEDISRLKYLKRLLRKYKSTGVLRERLILNHMIILHNVFNNFACRLMFYKLDEDLHSALKTFLIYLNYLPDTIPETDIVMIPVDENIANKLRTI